MKKTILFTFLLTAIFALAACNGDDAPVLGAKVDVTVKNALNAPLSGTTVYLYKDVEPTVATKPQDAYAQVVTDGNGLASFRLNFTQLNILESQTSLYFVVFYTVGTQSFVAGTGAVTVTRNDEKAVSITVPV